MKGNQAKISIKIAKAKSLKPQTLFCMRETPLGVVVDGAAPIIVVKGVAMLGVVIGGGVVETTPPVFVTKGTPPPPVFVAPLPPSRTFPASVQKLSKPVTIERLSGAAEETNSAHVKTAPSKIWGNHAVLVGLTLL